MQRLKQARLLPIEALGLVLVAALVFVWPIPGSIALRNGLLVLAVVVWLAQWMRTPEAKPRLPALRAPLLWYAALTAWLLAGAFLVSADTTLSLKEMKGQWLRSAVAGLLGWLMASWAVRPRFDPHRAKLCLLVLAGPIVLQILVTLGDTVGLWISQGFLPERIARLTGGKLGMSFNVNVLFALIAADVLSRIHGRGVLLPVSNAALLVLGATGIACTYVIGARNGTFCLVALVVLALAIHFRDRARARRDLAGIVVIAAALAAVGYASFKSDYRWEMFEESAALAWNTESSRAWLDPGQIALPVLHNGKKVEVSTYLRIAWLKEGTKVLLERPLGVGFMRGAMGRAFQDKYGDGLGGHADNGLIDFSLAAGLPGTFLGAALLCSLLLIGWRAYARCGSAVGLAGFLVVLGYAMRTLLDSTTRDNYLEQFLFMAALFATLAAAEWEQAKARATIAQAQD